MNDMIHVKERGRERSQRLTEKMKGKKMKPDREKTASRQRGPSSTNGSPLAQTWHGQATRWYGGSRRSRRRGLCMSPPYSKERKISLLYNISFPTLYHYKYTYSLVSPSEPPTLDPLTYHQILILKEILSSRG